MAVGKLYIGRKVRELRLANGATQEQFSRRLGISISYLNQIENNQRPVSASVLLLLAEKFNVALADLSEGEDQRLLSALIETLSDPLFANFPNGARELKLVAQNAPEVAKALIAVHQAYRHNSEQLASVGDRIGRDPNAINSSYEEVRDFFHFVDNYVHELDTDAESIAQEIGISDHDSYAVLVAHLEKKYCVRVKWTSGNGEVVRSFDAKTRILSLNPYLPVATRTFQVALQIAQLRETQTIDDIIARAAFRNDDAAEICRIGLHNYFAGALVLPYRRFKEAAKEVRHDVDLLALRFGASIEQVCHRLSTLQRPGDKGVPVFFARVDRAGNITKRHSTAKLQFARFGAACPLWNIHMAFESPGNIIRQLAETPDGVRYLSVATQISKGGRGFHSAQQHFALALGCEISYAADFVYADNLEIGNGAMFNPIGISCRICERPDCSSRASPPIKSRLMIDHSERRALPYQLQSAANVRL